MLQLTHLKIQQAIAKAKPDGLIIDIEGLENVQLGKGGELEPLEIHDIYEQTGVFYYRSKNPEGGFQNPPVREIGNAIRNIQELVGFVQPLPAADQRHIGNQRIYGRHHT